MHKDISDRFLKCLEALKKDNRIRSTRQFALSLEIHPQCISDVVRGKREVSNDMIYRSTEIYGFNPTFLFTGKGALFMDAPETFDLPVTDPILTIVTDNTGEERIVHVPVEAQAGYGESLHDPVYIKDLPSFTLPGHSFNRGTYRCFDVSGDSMEPTLYSGDKVVCSFIEADKYFNVLRDNYVYVVITNNGVVVKRVQNLIRTEGHILLHSDNSYYTPYPVTIEDVREIWQVTHKISPLMPSPSHVRNGLHTEVDLLKDTIADQSKMIKSLNATVEKLLKQNRSASQLR